MKARQLLTEAPIDFQGVPDFIPPEKKRKIERGGHPYSDFGSFPRQAAPGAYPPGADEPQPGGPVQNYAELLASDQYPKIVKKLAQYAGVTPARLGAMMQQPGGLFGLVGQAMGRAMRVQSAHRAELEQAAVSIVLDLPEFRMAAEAVQAGELRIEAKLVQGVTPDDMRPQADAPNEQQQQELEIAQIALELNAEKEKRRMINMMIQGAAVNKSYAFHLISDRLNELDPQLVNAFGFLMAFGDFMYWSVPDEVQQRAHREGGGAGQPMGKSRFRIGEDGVPVIEAEAVLFPILIHEVVKGLMEFISHSEDDDSETRRFVHSQVDTLDNEPWDMKLGAPLWRQILRMIGNDNQHLMPLIYRELVKLSPEQFKRRMHALLSGDAEARAWIRQLVQDIQADMQESSPAAALAARLLG